MSEGKKQREVIPEDILGTKLVADVTSGENEADSELNGDSLKIIENKDSEREDGTFGAGYLLNNEPELVNIAQKIANGQRLKEEEKTLQEKYPEDIKNLESHVSPEEKIQRPRIEPEKGEKIKIYKGKPKRIESEIDILMKDEPELLRIARKINNGEGLNDRENIRLVSRPDDIKNIRLSLPEEGDIDKRKTKWNEFEDKAVASSNRLVEDILQYGKEKKNWKNERDISGKNNKEVSPAEAFKASLGGLSAEDIKAKISALQNKVSPKSIPEVVEEAPKPAEAFKASLYGLSVEEIKAKIAALQNKVSPEPTKEAVEKPSDIKNSIENKEKLQDDLNETASQIEVDNENREGFEPVYDDSPESRIAYVKNQTVKLDSGEPISKKNETLIKMFRNKIFKYTAIAGILIGSGIGYAASEKNKGEFKFIPIKEIGKEHTTEVVVGKTVKTFEPNFNLDREVLVDKETQESLPHQSRDIYNAMLSEKENYTIVDKPTSTMFLIGSDNKLVHQMPVILGSTKGESENKGEANPTTPAGRFLTGRFEIPESDALIYKGRSFRLYGTNDISVHSTYPGELKKRTHALNTLATEDNRMSWGCINVDPLSYDKYIKGKFDKEDGTLFVTPDNPKTHEIDTKTWNLIQKTL